MRSYNFASVLTALTALSLAHSQTYSLHRQFRVGEVDTYSCVVKVAQQMTIMGNAQPFSFSGDEDMVFKTQKLVPSGAAVDLTTTANHMDFGAMAGMMGGADSKIPKVVHTTGNLDIHNRFSPKEAESATMQSLMGGGSMDQSSAILIELPDHPVKIGDSWTMAMPQLKSLGVTGKPLRVKLVGVGQVHGHSVLKVKVSGTMPLDMDLAKAIKAMAAGGGAQSPLAGMPSGMSMHLVGTMTFNGTGAIDPRTGKTVSLDSGIGTDMTVKISSAQGGAMGPMSMKTSGTTSMKIKLAGY